MPNYFITLENKDSKVRVFNSNFDGDFFHFNLNSVTESQVWNKVSASFCLVIASLSDL